MPSPVQLMRLAHLSLGDSGRGRTRHPWRLWWGEACLPPLGPPTLGPLPTQGILSRGPHLDLTWCLKFPPPPPGTLLSGHIYMSRGTRGTTEGKQLWAISHGTGPENLPFPFFFNEEMKEQRDQVTSFRLFYESDVEVRKVSSSQLFG